MNEKPEKIRQILAQNIKKRREYLGMSQERLAELTDLSVQTINTIECCRMWVSDKTITKLARVLDMEVFQLLVPYQLSRNEVNASTASALLELRQKIKNDVDNFNLLLDVNFKEALKSPTLQRSREKTESQKPIRAKVRRTR